MRATSQCEDKRKALLQLLDGLNPAINIWRISALGLMFLKQTKYNRDDDGARWCNSGASFVLGKKRRWQSDREALGLREFSLSINTTKERNIFVVMARNRSAIINSRSSDNSINMLAQYVWILITILTHFTLNGPQVSTSWCHEEKKKISKPSKRP